MKWSRFFRRAGFLVVIFAAFLALIWYGKQLDGLTLFSITTYVFAVSSVGLSLAFIITAVKQRWWRRRIDEGLVRRRLGAFYYVVCGILFLSFVTLMAIKLRALELERDLSGPLPELSHLLQAMSTVSMTLIFVAIFLMIRLSRSIHDEASGADGDR